jgi:hypothetical protein
MSVSMLDQVNLSDAGEYRFIRRVAPMGAPDERS